MTQETETSLKKVQESKDIDFEGIAERLDYLDEALDFEIDVDEYDMDAIKEAISALRQSRETITRLSKALAESDREVDRLRGIVDTPENDDFISAIAREGEHQRGRWDDSDKTDWDWFWLVGYLSQKAASNPEKRKHHIITTCAALLNWHRQALKRE